MIDFWYEDEPVFGRPGLAQKWINLPGSISDAHEVESCHYTFNGGRQRRVELGPDYHRLAEKGDFNLEIPVRLCKEGRNELVLWAIRKNNRTESRKISFEVYKNRPWPRNWQADFTKTDASIRQVQIVDGLWERDDCGLTVKKTYYDRIIAFGDDQWRNYSVKATVRCLGVRMPGSLDGGRSVIHFGLALRWNGHSTDSFQPHRKWYPLGITSEFRLDSLCTRGAWRMLASPKERWELDKVKEIQPGKTYIITGQVFDVKRGQSCYRVKLREAGTDESSGWDLQVYRPTAAAESGGGLLVAHYSRLCVEKICVKEIGIPL